MLRPPKPKSQRRPFDWRKRKILKGARNQAPLKVKDTGKARTASDPTFRKRKQSDSIAGLGKAIAGAFGKKKIPGLDNKMFKSGTGEWVGTEEAYARDVPDYIDGDAWMKHGGSIKKKIKKKKSKAKKRSALRGYGAALRGF
tara:strand:- start:382 stop:807 length:426 start_codon:yes stop_codon:yes gene_type:complete